MSDAPEVLEHPFPKVPTIDEMAASFNRQTDTAPSTATSTDAPKKGSGRKKGSKQCPTCRKIFHPSTGHTCPGATATSTSNPSRETSISRGNGVGGGESEPDPVKIAKTGRFVKAIFNAVDTRVGPRGTWKLSDDEVNDIAEPLSEVLPELDNPYIALSVALLVTCGPRALASMNHYKAQSAREFAGGVSGPPTPVMRPGENDT